MDVVPDAVFAIAGFQEFITFCVISSGAIPPNALPTKIVPGSQGGAKQNVPELLPPPAPGLVTAPIIPDNTPAAPLAIACVMGLSTTTLMSKSPEVLPGKK